MSNQIPHHVAIIMDGNGRWALQRHLPRVAGHKAGVESVREIVQISGEVGVEVLTLFAFGQENWRRPKEEVGFLMNLLLSTLKHEIKKLHKNNVCLKLIGDRSALNSELQKVISESEEKTANNTGLQLNLAVNYSGLWDINTAFKQIAKKIQQQEINLEDINDDLIFSHLATQHCPNPDLFIRTSGEYRISNFMLMQLAYTELYFCETLWPDFRRQDYEKALHAYSQRQRRFGYTGQQLQQGLVEE